MEKRPASGQVRRPKRKRLVRGGTIGAALAEKLGTENVQGYILDRIKEKA